MQPIRHRLSMLSRIGVLSVGAALAVSACSSSGSSPSASSSGDAASSSSGSSAVAPFAADLAKYYKGEFTSPPTAAPSPSNNVNLWIISCGQASEGCSGPSAAAKTAAQKLGWKVTVFDGNFGTGDAYNGGLRQAIAAHATAIITVGVDCNLAKTGYQARQGCRHPRCRS